MMKSIRKRLLVDFMVVIAVAVVILDALLINFVKQYYYNNVETVLTNQIKIATDYYTRYLGEQPLADNVLANTDLLSHQTLAQVQVIDHTGKVLLDSIGVMPPDGKLRSDDVRLALQGQKGKWIGNVDYGTAKVMAVAYPLRDAEGKIVGALRFVTSLAAVNQEIVKVALIFLAVGALVIALVFLMSIFLANSIIEPLKELTAVAEQMAAGNYKVRSRRFADDEIGKLATTLNQMAAEIVQKDRLKNEFISGVSHELRTPLTSIKGWAVALQNIAEDDRATRAEGLQIIEQESDRLTGMVEELLDFSRFVSGQITLNKEEIRIAELVEHVRKQLGLRAARERLYFRVDCAANLPPLYADPNRIKQVLINVLDNAFKFTPPGGTVTLSCCREGNNLVLRVADNGCGISAADLPRVTEKFYKGANSKSQNGIGLSICDEIIRLHHGLLTIDSELGKGTTVTISLPYGKAEIAG